MDYNKKYLVSFKAQVKHIKMCDHIVVAHKAMWSHGDMWIVCAIKIVLDPRSPREFMHVHHIIL